MQILARGTWQGGFPDLYRRPAEARVRVVAMVRLERVRSLYFEQPRDVRRMWNYVREVGPRAVVAKVRSRRAESGRNEKFVSVGLGVVVESDGLPAVDTAVWFAAPAHPGALERLSLPRDLLRPVADPTWRERALTHTGAPRTAQRTPDSKDPATLSEGEFAGWSPDAGRAVPVEPAQVLLDSARELVEESWETPEPTTGWAGASLATEIVPADPSLSTPEAEPALPVTVVGFGHYAKISILPNLDERLQLQRVHEIDPTQVGSGPHPFSVDSAPAPRAADPSRVFFLAGFHHTHAPLAADALRRGAHVVIEKPIATTDAQLADVMDAVATSKGSVHVGFHKRYQPFNAWAREDLDALAQEPISYYCIAYEVPLPRLHWYRWPNSGSRLLSNGCHWVDHFLYLNDFVKVRELGVDPFPNGDVSVRLVLVNDAAFHMVLTDQGGARIGVQDHIELRRRDRTARISNASRYVAEDDRRVLRRAKENKTLAYARMYRTISSNIAAGAPGDRPESIERSAGTVLELERRLQHALKKKSVRVE